MNRRTLGGTLVFLGVIAVVASGCGRRAALYTPYRAAVEARKQAKDDKKPLPPEPVKPDKDRPFFLDRIIK